MHNSMDGTLQGLEKTLDRVWLAVSGEKNPKGFSKWIEWYHGRNFSHSLGFYVSRDSGDFVVANCHGTGNQLDTPDQFSRTAVLRRVFEIKVNEIERQSFARRITELDGAPYSSTIQMAWLVIANIIKAKWSPFADQDESFWCSEYADQLMAALGLETSAEILNKGRTSVTPLDNVKALEILADREKSRVTEIIL